MASTAATIIGYIENITNIDVDEIGVPGVEETQLLNIIHQANLEYYNAHIQGGGEPPLQFVSEFGVDILDGTTLSEDVATTDVEFNIGDSSSLQSSGAAVIFDDNTPDIFEYTTNTANNVSGVTKLSFGHENGDSLYALYALPSDFASFRSEHDNPDGVLVAGRVFRYTSSSNPLNNQFTVYDNGTTKYLQFPRGLGSVTAFVKYNTAPTTINDTTDTIIAPEADEYFIVYRAVEHVYTVLAMNKDEIDRARGLADDILRRSLIRRNIGKRVRIGRRFVGYPHTPFDTIPATNLRDG
jgi:hypothetical protein